jgi:glyoxylase-like metal-dependent hydrolase (beta-lactamase superfamily II)
MRERPGVERFGPDGRLARVPTPTGFPVGDINSYLILPRPGSEALVLVDTGVRSDAAREALEKGLERLGFRVEDLTLVLLTHAHPDHFGQAASLARRAGCPVWAHEAAQAAIDRYALPTPPERLHVVRAFLRSLGVPPERAEAGFGPPGGRTIVEHLVPDRVFRDGERLELPDFPLLAIHTPGHCPDLAVFWHEPSGSLLSGDHLLPDITPVCLFDVPARPDGERVHTLAQFHDSLDKVEPLPVRLVLPSHGDVLPRHRPLIRDYRIHTEKRKLELARLLQRRGAATPFELAREMFPRAWDTQLHLVLSEVLGHLDLLERAGNARVERRDGTLVYCSVSLPAPSV